MGSPAVAGVFASYLVVRGNWLGLGVLVVIVYFSQLGLYVRLRHETLRARREARAQGVYLDWITPGWRRNARLGRYYAIGLVGLMAVMLVGLVAAAIAK